MRHPKCSCCMSTHESFGLHCLHACGVIILMNRTNLQMNRFYLHRRIFKQSHPAWHLLHPEWRLLPVLSACSLEGFPAKSPKLLTKQTLVTYVVVMALTRLWGHCRKGSSSSHLPSLLQNVRILGTQGLWRPWPCCDKPVQNLSSKFRYQQNVPH